MNFKLFLLGICALSLAMAESALAAKSVGKEVNCRSLSGSATAIVRYAELKGGNFLGNEYTGMSVTVKINGKAETLDFDHGDDSPGEMFFFSGKKRGRNTSFKFDYDWTPNKSSGATYSNYATGVFIDMICGDNLR